MHCSLALRSGRLSRSCGIVVIIHCPAPGLTGHVTTSIRIPAGWLVTLRGSIVVSLLRELGLTWVFHDLVAVFVRKCFVRFLVGQGLVLLEGWKAALLAIFLFSLTFRLGLDGIHPYLIDVLIVARLEVSSTAPLAFSGWSVTETAPSATKQEAAEKEEDPSGDGEPDGVSD